MIMKWHKPEAKTVTFEQLSKTISARATSIPTIPVDPPSCNSCGECTGCAAACNPIALFWSCYSNFLVG